jgi:hypothetical protein
VIQNSCGRGEWTRPRPAFRQPAGTRLSAQDPSITVGVREAYIAGNDIAIYDGRAIVEPPVTIAILGGALIGRPKGQFNFVRPKVIEDYRERLHLLWAEPSTQGRLLATDEWGSAQVVTIWAATYTPSIGWTSPERVLEGRPFVWTQTHIWKEQAIGKGTGGAMRAGGVIALPVALFVPELYSPLLLLRLTDDRWIVDSIPNKVMGGKSSPSFASIGPREFIAYLGPDPAAQRDANSVIFQSSTDGGRTWSTASVVSRSGTQPAYDVQISVGKGGAVHLTWLQSTGNDTATLRHSVSYDNGASWSTPDGYGGAPAARNELRTVVDACGALHAVFENWSDGGNHSHLEHIVWAGGWQAPTRLFDGWYSRSAELALTSHGDPILVFVRSIATQGVGSAFEPVYSEFRRE